MLTPADVESVVNAIESMFGSGWLSASLARLLKKERESCWLD
jgi:hypothetical protein